MRRAVALLSATAVLAALVMATPVPAVAFSGFGTTSAAATYEVGMTFEVELHGGAPDRLEILLSFAGDEGTLVAPVSPDGDSAQYVWDTQDRFVTPNTLVTYRWRATDGDAVTLSQPRSLLYDDDRPGLDWHTARLGDATVHWYGNAESQARRFGDLSADGAARAEELLGHEMAGPVDIFVYDSQDDFFGALGPGAREWTGAATYPALRTIFMWLQGGPTDYLETTIVHEVTHVVFHDATDNPYHEPAKWLNEGFATWSEAQSAASQDSTVRFEASGGGLFAFEGISEQFPIGSRGASLSYAQGATMVDMILDEHGRDAMARISAAYRDGASDAEALEAGTDVPADELYAAYYDRYDVDAPRPVDPAPIPPSNVRRPGDGNVPVDGSPAPDGDPGSGPENGGPPGDPGPLIVVAVVAGVVVVGGATWYAQRRVRRQPS
jgi:hypothetical protein